MATLPTIGARPTPTPQRGIVSERGGQVIADAIGNLGQTVGRIGEEVSREADAQAVFEARRKLDEWERIAIYDPEGGAINRLGKDAFDLPEKMPAQFDEFAGKVAGELKTPRQKQAFQEMAQSRRSQVLDWTNRHTLKQREVYDEGQFRADLDSMRERATLFADDPAKVSGEIATANARIVGYMRGKGRSEEETRAFMVKNAADLHEGVVRSLIDTNPVEAKKYLDANGKHMDPASRRSIEKPLKAELDNLEAERLAASVATLPLGEQLTEGAKVQDPELRRKTLLRIKENEGLLKMAQQERERGFSDKAWQLVGQAKKVPSTVLEGMDGRERVQLQDYLRQRAEHAATKGSAAVKTDPVTLARLLDQQAGDPQAFAKEFRAEAYAYKLSGSDLEQMNRAKMAIQTPKPGKDLVTFNNKITSRIELAGWTGQAKDKQRGAFRAAAQKEWERLGDKAMSPKDEDALLDALMLPGKTGWFSDGEAATYAESIALGKPYQIRNDADFMSLPSGARFLDPSGKMRVKP